MCLVLPLVFTGGKAYDRHSAALCRRVSLGTDIPPVTYGRFSHPELGPLLPNPIPDTVCCVPLLSRRVFVHPQNLVDNTITGPSLGFARTGTLRSGRTALSACPNIRRCTPSCLATPGPPLLQSDTAAGSVQTVPPCVSCPSPSPSWPARTG
jgi:hypothetical protein